MDKQEKYVVIHRRKFLEDGKWTRITGKIEAMQNTLHGAKTGHVSIQFKNTRGEIEVVDFAANPENGLTLWSTKLFGVWVELGLKVVNGRLMLIFHLSFKTKKP